MTNKEDISAEEMNDFVIEESKGLDIENTDYDITSSDDVLDFDFSSDDEFDIENAFEFVKHSKVPKQTKELVEQKEADNVVKNTSEKFVSPEYVELMDNGYAKLLAILKRYEVNSDIIKAMNEEDKDKIYIIAEHLFNEYQKNLNSMDFNFELTQDEWKFMIDVLKNKLEYDQNEIFQMEEIRKQYLDGAEEIQKSLPRDIEEIPTIINVNNLIILYHLISKYKVKGINKQHYAFLTLLTKIGERIKLFNAYTVWVQRLSDDFQLWGGSLSIDDSIVNGTAIQPENPNNGE